jgi:hypothetical protein
VTVDLDELERLARAATPGPWEAPTQPESVVNVWTAAPEAAIRASDIAAHGEATGAAVFHELGNGIVQDVRGPDAAFIAAANPAAVLLLVARLRVALCFLERRDGEDLVRVTFEVVRDHIDAPFVRACTHIDGVPYYGSGQDSAAAVRHLTDTIRAHSAPLPDALKLVEL